MGVGKASEEKGKSRERLKYEGHKRQQPVITKARKSVAGFKLREGANVGVKVTLRKNKV